jgi:uncharacterized protein
LFLTTFGYQPEPMTDLPSTTNANREHFMDALRGFALLGIFIVNTPGFTNPHPEGPGPWIFPEADKMMFFLQTMFIEGKFYSIFSLLFGWGIALQIGRLGDIAIVWRRVFFMFFLGCVHLLLIWSGDIITFYALMAIPLLLLRRMSNRALIIIGVSLLLSPILFYSLRMNFPILRWPTEKLNDFGMFLDQNILGTVKPEDFEKLLREGSVLDLIKYNFDGFPYRFGELIFQNRGVKVLGMFLIGFVIGRSGFFKTALQHPYYLWIIAGIGLVLGIPFNYYLATMKEASGYHQFKIGGLYQTIYYALGVAPLAIAYVALLAIGFRTAIGQKILMLFAPAGKIAFTTYVAQSLTNTFVFYGIGLGLMGRMGAVTWTIYAIIVFMFQILVATFWLRYFQYGPLEWLWRSLTYNKRQPWLKQKAPM